MIMAQSHPVDFHTIDMTSGWEHPEGYPEGVEVKVLADTLDETRKTGHRTVLQRYAPGVSDPRVLVHDFVEEVLILDGELNWLDDHWETEACLTVDSYVCRPPNVPHGPFATDTGCLMIAWFYYPS